MVNPAGAAALHRVSAALAGGGAALLLTIGLWEAVAFVAPALFSGPTALFVSLGVVSGLAAGFVAGFTGPAAPGWAASGAWGVWALTVATTLSAAGPRETDPASLLPVTLLLGLVVALGGAVVGQAAGAGNPWRGTPAAGLVGALVGFAVLALGVAVLGATAAALRPGGVTAEHFQTVYLRWMRAALWAVVALAGGFSLLPPVLRPDADRSARPAWAAAALGVSVFLVLGALVAPAADFYLACLVGTPLPPFRWLTGGASC